MLLFEPIQLALSIPTFVGSETSAVLEISVDPLFAEHCKKRYEGWSCEAGTKQGLYCDNTRRWTDSDYGIWICVGEEGTVRCVDKDLHVGGGHLVWVGFQLGLNIGCER